MLNKDRVVAELITERGSSAVARRAPLRAARSPSLRLSSGHRIGHRDRRAIPRVPAQRLEDERLGPRSRRASASRLNSAKRWCVCQRRGRPGGLGLVEQELAPDTGRAEVLPGSPCLAKLVDDEQPEAAWGLVVRREHARSQA